MPSKLSGNRTGPRGSRYIQNVHIDKEPSRTIKILVLARGWPYDAAHVAKWIEEQAECQWQVFGAEIMANAELEEAP